MPLFLRKGVLDSRLGAAVRHSARHLRDRRTMGRGDATGASGQRGSGGPAATAAPARTSTPAADKPEGPKMLLPPFGVAEEEGTGAPAPLLPPLPTYSCPSSLTTTVSEGAQASLFGNTSDKHSVTGNPCFLQH
jgi:hypothetical protein